MMNRKNLTVSRGRNGYGGAKAARYRRYNYRRYNSNQKHQACQAEIHRHIATNVGSGEKPFQHIYYKGDTALPLFRHDLEDRLATVGPPTIKPTSHEKDQCIVSHEGRLDDDDSLSSLEDDYEECYPIRGGYDQSSSEDSLLFDEGDEVGLNNCLAGQRLN